jgi:carbamoyltransferase
MVYILGISAFYHDSAACLLKDSSIVAAAQEERFSRKKNDEAFPRKAIEYCLQQAKITAKELDYVVFYDKPWLKFERLIKTYLLTAPLGFRSFLQAIPSWLKQKLWTRSVIEKELKIKNIPILFTEHHQAHAGSAFFPSPFKNAAILTIDGVGEFTTTSISLGKENKIKQLKELHFPHSLGLLYSAFTYYLGFKVNSDEYKVMGLAPYGEPKYKNLIYKHLIDLKPDGSFHLNVKYFDYIHGLKMTNQKFSKLFGLPPKKPKNDFLQKHLDIARSIQEVTEEIVLKLAKHVHQLTGEENLCLAGGVALNCVANGRLKKEGPFKNILIQPASGDAGGALGAALTVWYEFLNNKRKIHTKDQDTQSYSLLGPQFSLAEIESFLKKNSIKYTYYKSTEQAAKTIAKFIATGKIIGLFQGRMEYGPRALGCRSILADPRDPKMQSHLNNKIKFRESFRPFAPAILEENTADYFDLPGPSPYMLFTAKVNKKHLAKNFQKQENGLAKLKTIRSDIPAVTHVDNSARLQTVNKKQNPYFYKIIREFKQLTGCPIIINTSFNVREEPIVCTPQDAYNCFNKTGIDILVLESFIIEKKNENN